MNIVKLTCPSDWTVKSNFNTGFHMQTPGLSGIWNNYKFLINDLTDECDYWLVYGFLENPETITVRKKTVLHLSEEVGIKRWNDNFMHQFDVVMGSQRNINHSHYIHDHYVCGWHVQKSYDQLTTIMPPHKSKILSVIASDTKTTEGHRKRYAFVKKMKDHFCERLDWFGKGNNFIQDKWDGLYDYKYSIAIENQQAEGYWTEKMADCFLAYTIPLYYGCTNIDRYFPKGSYINIDPANISRSIDIIEEVVASDFYNENLDALQEARELVLKKYNFMSKVTEWLDMINEDKNTASKITLYPETHFVKPRPFNRMRNWIYKALHN